ncbi:hypothetical protein Hanom_Chr14g01318711 [Helianthus anomalus]
MMMGTTSIGAHSSDMPPSPAVKDVEEDASNTGPKNTTSNSVEEGKLSPETCSTPSKSPCSTNSMSAEIPTPISLNRSVYRNISHNPSYFYSIHLFVRYSE